jgi:CHAT domain-containing protein
MFTLPPFGKPLQLLSDPGVAWLEVEERGQEVTLGEPARDAVDIPIPLRYGAHWIPGNIARDVLIRRVEPDSAHGVVGVTLYCTSSAVLDARTAWLRRAGYLTKRIGEPLNPDGLAAVLADIHALGVDAPDVGLHALATHLNAQALLVSGHNGDSVLAFQDAETEWLVTGDADKALIARMARAEDMYRTGHYATVLQIADVGGGMRLRSYAAVRLHNTKCLALQTLGRGDEADTCYARSLAGYKRLDERSEYVVALQGYASAQRARGNLGKAEALARLGIEQAVGPDAPLVRGRLHLVLADVALLRGDVAKSLIQTNQALTEFDVAHAPRWQANAMLGLAELYIDLGAKDEAYAALLGAANHLSARDSLARTARAMLLLSGIEHESSHTTSAELLAQASETIYRELGIPKAVDQARLARLNLELAQNRVGAVAQGLSERGSADGTKTPGWQLLSADFALKTDRLDVAAEQLVELADRQDLSLTDRVRLARLESDYWVKRSDPARARQILEDMAEHVLFLGSATRNPVLDYLVSRETHSLRRAAFELSLSTRRSDTDREQVNTLLRWFVPMASTSIGKGARDQKSSYDERFDRAIAQELLTSPVEEKSGADTSPERALLALMAQTRDGGVIHPNMGASEVLGELQRRLDADSVLVGYVEAEKLGALLWITRDHASVVPAASPDDLRKSAELLRHMLGSANTPVGEIRSAAQRLSQQLFANAPRQRSPPRRLYVLANDELGSIPLSLLEWPGGDGNFLETSIAEYVNLGQWQAGHGEGAGAPLHIFVASPNGSDAHSLPDLPAAAAESRQIQHLVTQRPVIGADKGRASPQAILAALSDPGAWVHIAAHGVASSKGIGFGGLWLDPLATANDVPRFLSWLDLLGLQVSADLVVIDACELGGDGGTQGDSLSFAMATSNAGAKEVVAALWPISDSSSALWVPAFYSALQAGAHVDIASATRTAQLALRASRAFRHPFFWAGIQTISRWPVAPNPSRGSSALRDAVLMRKNLQRMLRDRAMRVNLSRSTDRRGSGS